MKEFLFKNSFVRYYVSLFNRNGIYKRRGLGLLFGICFFGGLFTSFWSAGAAFYGFYVFFICAILGMNRRNMPNLTGLMPLTSRRKIVYQYLSPIVTMILITIFMVLFSFVMYLLIYFYSLIAGWHPEFEFFVPMFEGLIDAFESMGVYGSSFALIFTLFSFSCGMAFGFLRKTLHRVIYVIAFMLIIYFGFYGIAYPSIDEYYFAFGYASPFTPYAYENMQLPWLCILLSAIVAVGAFVGSVVYVNKTVGKKGF